MKLILTWLGIMGWLGLGAAQAADQGDQVAVVYNTRVPESKDVAEHYALMRHVPARQVMGFDLPDQETISRAEFHDHLQKRLLKELESKGLWHFDSITVPATDTEPKHEERKLIRSSIRYLVLCYGVPLIIARDRFLREPEADKLPPMLQRNEAAVDSELACLPVLDHMLLAGVRTNIQFDCANAQLMNPTNGLLIVTRLDGPSAAIAHDLVDKAMQAERDGLWGRAYFDLRGLTNGNYVMGDQWIAAAARVCRSVGYETVVDTNGGTFPAGFPLSQVAFYAGWYDENVSGPFALPTVEFMPGAFAYHLHSFSAATLRSAKRQWVGPLLARGVTATMGTVDEPYLPATPNIGVFFDRFIHHDFSFGEAAYAAQAFLSWQTTVVGDPLYRPFTRGPEAYREDLLKRHSPMLPWVEVCVADCNINAGVPLATVTRALENSPDIHQSAVLQERLAAFYLAEGKPSSSVHALQQALKLDPTPQQKKRLLLTVAERLIALDRGTEAYDVYQQFARAFPDYPDKLTIYGQLLELAKKLGKKEDAEDFQRKINQLQPARNIEHYPLIR